MKFIRTYENFTEMSGNEMEEMCPECQCKVTECECGGPMSHEHEMDEEEMGHEGMPEFFSEEEYGDDEEDRFGFSEEEYGHESDEEDVYPEEEEGFYSDDTDEEGIMPSGHRMGHIMSFQEAKKADKEMTKKEKELAAKYPPKDKITRGDIITAAKENADKKKGGKEDKKDDKKEDKKSSKKGGLSKTQEKQLPEPLKKAIKAGVKD